MSGEGFIYFTDGETLCGLITFPVVALELLITFTWEWAEWEGWGISFF